MSLKLEFACELLLFSSLTCVQAALVAIGSAQTEAAVTRISRLREGRRGVNGVPSTAQNISGIQELGVGNGLHTKELV